MGTITSDELARKLVSSRKIMNKVDSGDYQSGIINKEILLSSPEELMNESSPSPVNRRPIGKSDPDRINQSKLPDAIKQAMINNPIPEISLNEGLDMDFVNKARRLMEEDGSIPKKQQQSKQNTNSASVQLTSSELERRLTPIIENVIRKTLDEIVDRKLNQILNAQNSTTINENLAIKVGDSIFTGKITKVKST